MKKQRVRFILSIFLCVTLLLSQSVTAVYAEDLLITDNSGATVTKRLRLCEGGDPASGDPEKARLAKAATRQAAIRETARLAKAATRQAAIRETARLAKAATRQRRSGRRPVSEGDDPASGDPVSGEETEQEAETDLMLPNLLLEAGAWRGLLPWYLNDPEAAEFTVSQEAELRYLAQLSTCTATDGEGSPIAAVDFSWKTITLDDDIALTEAWTPIGTAAGPLPESSMEAIKPISGLTITGMQRYTRACSAISTTGRF